MLCPPELKTAYDQGRLLPFLGAGISMSVSWEQGDTQKRGPSWTELVNTAARLLGYDEPDLLRVRGQDLQILEYYKEKNHGRITPLTNWLVREMSPPDDALKASKIHFALAKLLKCRVFYTTNYDDFIERAFTLLGRPCRSVAVEAEMSRTDSHECEVVKFHGDLEHPDQMVVTESDYEGRLKLIESMDYRLRADMLNRVLLFLGYSFRDPNVAYLFRLVNEQFGRFRNLEAGRRAYIVVANPSDFEKVLFAARNIGVIAANRVELTDFTVQLLSELAGGA